MKPVHPGRLLRREMQARKLSANALALALRVSSGRITDILNGKRGISPETAMRLARYFGNSARFWLYLQTTYELGGAEAEFGQRIPAEVAPPAARPGLPRGEGGRRRRSDEGPLPPHQPGRPRRECDDRQRRS